MAPFRGPGGVRLPGAHGRRDHLDAPARRRDGRRELAGRRGGQKREAKEAVPWETAGFGFFGG